MKSTFAFGVLLFSATALTTSATAQSLAEQERCAVQAKTAFQAWETDQKTGDRQFGTSLVSADYQSHFNIKSQKCLMLIESSSQLGKQFSNQALLVDANERRVYAYYLWISHEGKKYWEVPPATCDLIPSLREKNTCSTRDEFDEFVAGYLE